MRADIKISKYLIRLKVYKRAGMKQNLFYFQILEKITGKPIGIENINRKIHLWYFLFLTVQKNNHLW